MPRRQPTAKDLSHGERKRNRGGNVERERKRGWVQSYPCALTSEEPGRQFHTKTLPLLLLVGRFTITHGTPLLHFATHTDVVRPIVCKRICKSLSIHCSSWKDYKISLLLQIRTCSTFTTCPCSFDKPQIHLLQKDLSSKEYLRKEFASTALICRIVHVATRSPALLSDACSQLPPKAPLRYEE